MQRSLKSASCLWPCHLPQYRWWNTPLLNSQSMGGGKSLMTYHLQKAVSWFPHFNHRLPFKLLLPLFQVTLESGSAPTGWKWTVVFCFLPLFVSHSCSCSTQSIRTQEARTAVDWRLYACLCCFVSLLFTSTPKSSPLADCETCLPRTWPCLACFWVPCHEQRSQ